MNEDVNDERASQTLFVTGASSDTVCRGARMKSSGDGPDRDAARAFDATMRMIVRPGASS